MKTIISFLVIFFLSVGIAYFILKPGDELPIYQPKDINPALVDQAVRNRTDHRVSDFRLVNQLGDTVSRADVGDKIIVANFFFAKCATICPVMNANMSKIHEANKQANDLMLLSHSVTPDIDSVAILYDYAERFNADNSRWWFLTGDKKQIYDLARRSYFAVLDEGDGGLQDFIHTENIVLIDRLGRLRGYYDGTKGEDIDQIISDIEILRKEEIALE
jgi:protein SCO1